MAQNLKELISNKEKTGKVYGKVFDENTSKTILSLASKGYFDHLECLLNEGKEANLYLARDYSGEEVAVKIYKVLTSNFKKMKPYLQGDIRFKEVKKTRHGIISQWAKKEYKNLEILQECRVKSPYPVSVKNNVLVMEFIGKKGVPAKMLKYTKKASQNKLFKKIGEYIARMLYLGELIHADLSEYNILMQAGKPVIIDVGQAVPTTHPNAEKFFYRDISNMENYFSKHGTKKGLLKEVKKWKQKLKHEI